MLGENGSYSFAFDGFGIANSRFIENTETRKLITEIKLKLKYWTQNQTKPTHQGPIGGCTTVLL